MKRFTLFALSALFLNISGYGQLISLTEKNQITMDTQQIAQNILKTLEEGWNNSNGTEFATHFADVAEFVDIRGTLYPNATRQAIAEAHQGLFMSIYKESKIRYKLIQAISIEQNLILVNASTELEVPSGPLTGSNSSTITMIIIKVGDKWQIRAFHNTLVMKQ